MATVCCPESSPREILGSWRTRFGIYSITQKEEELHFREDQLHGILRADGGWYVAEIRDGGAGDQVFGYLRLKRSAEGMCSSFKKQPGSWEGAGVLDATMLPYLNDASPPGGAQQWEQSTCCICMESFDEEEEGTVAELRCRHLFHKACIHDWFLRNGSCPMRCGAKRRRTLSQ